MNNVDDEAIRILAALPPLKYDRKREEEAKRLKCRVGTLDNLVEEARRLSIKKDDSELQGEPVIFADDEPWQEPVHGAEVFSGISATVAAYCAVPDGAPDIIALWAGHTHCYELFRISPRLHITSPTYGCGKSTLRDVVALFVRRPLSAESLSTAVGFRVVHEHKPTLLADEIDRWLINNEELCGFFNSNYKRGAVFLRCDGDDNKVRAFNAFSPVVLCGIGALRGRLATLHDRSIVVRMGRAKPGELLAPFDEGRIEKERELNRKLLRWMTDNRERIALCNPRLPDGVFNRLADNWRPLFAIAEVLGGEWPGRCVESFRKLTANKLDVETRDIELLRDIHDILRERNGELVDGWLPSSDLITLLLDKPESPWGEANKGGKPINERWLSVRLADYSIKPGRLPRDGGERKRGYKAAAFQDVFDRYVPSGQVSHQPILRGKMSGTDSGTDRKFQVSHQVSQDFTREKSPCGTDGHLGSLETGVSTEAPTTASNGEYCDGFRKSKTVYPGNWIKLDPDETPPHWQAALKEALAKPCEVCGEQMGDDSHLWTNIKSCAVNCAVCRETHWWADGYEIDEYGLPSCWSHKHTREQRIAERTRNQIQKAAQYRAQKAGVDYFDTYQALVAQEPEETRRVIEQLDEKEQETLRRLWQQEQEQLQLAAMTAGEFVAEATSIFNAAPSAESATD